MALCVPVKSSEISTNLHQGEHRGLLETEKPLKKFLPKTAKLEGILSRTENQKYKSPH